MKSRFQWYVCSSISYSLQVYESNGIMADHRQESDAAWLLCAALTCHLAPSCA